MIDLPFYDHVKTVTSNRDGLLGLQISMIAEQVQRLLVTSLTSSCVIWNTSLPAIELRKSLGLRPILAARLLVAT